MPNDTTAKLADCEARMRRWHSRLTRASNALQKLERQRRRLLLQQQVGVGQPRPKAKPVPVISTDDPDLVEKVAAAMEIPPFLNRSDPMIAERMNAARKKAEEADRHKMPLTGKAAMAAIMAVPVKPKPKRKPKG